jgi:prolyl oligopeptidase
VHVEQQAGHGAGKPRSKQADELADRWSFFASQLGLDFGFSNVDKGSGSSPAG